MSHSSRLRSKIRQRHRPLEEDLVATGSLRTKSNKRKGRPDEENEGFVDSRSSRKILKIGQELLEEEEKENGPVPRNTAFDFESRQTEDPLEDLEPDHDDEDAWGDEEEVAEEVEIDPSEMQLFDKFMPLTESAIMQNNGETNSIPQQGTNLSDLILEKIAAHEAANSGQIRSEEQSEPEAIGEIPPKVVEVYSKYHLVRFCRALLTSRRRIGIFLSRYKSGKLPKPFKLIPTMPRWEEIVEITRPESWTPHACLEATRIFVSSKSHVAQSFFETVILGHVRSDIHETKKLNVHLYNALKRALYKPAAFFKGFLFPLVESGTCTLREAHIVSSILVKVSIPVLHSAAALLRLTEIAAEQTTSMPTENAGATNVFIRVLLEKKYALPYRVIDALVFHFLRYRIVNNRQTSTTQNDFLGLTDEKLPVIWHQCLLAFAQRYRNDIEEDQREALLDLLLTRGHKDISAEVRRELLQGRGRGVIIPQGIDDGGDDTMVLDPS